MKLLTGMCTMSHTTRLMSNERSLAGWGGGSSHVKRFSLALLVFGLGVSMFSIQAQAMDSRLQIFVEVVGSIPDWSELKLTISQLNVTGFSTTDQHFSVTPFDGSRQLVIPRAAAGTARFLVAGKVPPGRVDQINLTLGQVELLADQPLAGTRQRFVPDVIENGAVKLQYDRPLAQADGEVLSLVVSIKLGDNTVVNQDGILVLDPVLMVERLSSPPGPENFLNGDETLMTGPTQAFPELGIQIVRAKIYDHEGRVRDLTLRKDTGEPVSFSEVRRQNETLWRAEHGTLGLALVEHLAALPSTGLVAADVWLRVPGEETFQTAVETNNEWDIAHSAFVAARIAAGAPIAATVSAALEAAGATILRIDLHPSVLHIQASREVLETTAAHIADVLAIEETPPVGDIIATKGAIDLVQNPLWLVHLLLVGNDLRIGIIEPKACVNTAHEAFRGVIFEDPVGGPCTSLNYEDGHSTSVASALAATVGQPGSIDLVGLFQGHLFTYGGACVIMESVLKRNPNLINLSCVPAPQQSLDHAVYADRIFVANGSGNVESGEDSSTLPVYCYSYNSVCVGGYNHSGTLGPGNFEDDTPGGRWLNDATTGREEPDLIGVMSGYFAHYSDNNKYVPTGGTSFATPLVVGTAGLLMANYKPDLKGDPTLLRAVLMASASHPLPGFPPVAIYSDGIDDRGGAGAPRGDRGRAIMEDRHFFTDYVDRDLDFDASGNLTTPILFHANAGEKVRVVLTYDQCRVELNSIHDVLLADMDLVVSEKSLESGAQGTRVHTNNSHVDNSEIVEFTVSANSQINVNIRVQHWDPCTNGERKTYLAIAWDILPAP